MTITRSEIHWKDTDSKEKDTGSTWKDIGNKEKASDDSSSESKIPFNISWDYRICDRYPRKAGKYGCWNVRTKIINVANPTETLYKKRKERIKKEIENYFFVLLKGIPWDIIKIRLNGKKEKENLNYKRSNKLKCLINLSVGWVRLLGKSAFGALNLT